jgi:hypothetical protein
MTENPLMGNFLRKIIRDVNSIADGAGVAVRGDLAPPPPVNAITVKASGETIHATLTHGAAVTRQIGYSIEASNTPGFTQPHLVRDNSSSRSHIFTLPTFDDHGAVQPWYLRAFAQYPGSPPSKPTVLGGLANPTPLMLQGTTRMTLLPSTGSGTGSTAGQQGGVGRGKQRQSTPKVIRVGKSQASIAPVVNPQVGPPIHLLAAVASASQTTALSQSGTSAAINVAAGTFYVGNLVVNVNAAPSALTTDMTGAALTFTTYYVFHDDPAFAGGNVKYMASTDITQIGRGFARFYDGKITLAGGGGGSGGGSGGGGGRGFF